MPTPDEIRKMDGPALTRLAWRLGLAPEGVVWDEAWLPHVPVPCWQDRHGVILATSARWNPHEDLAKATDAMRRVRERGWDTHVQYFASTATGQVGVWKRVGDTLLGQLLQWHGGAACEAETILRCAVLAAASEKE